MVAYDCDKRAFGTKWRSSRSEALVGAAMAKRVGSWYREAADRG